MATTLEQDTPSSLSPNVISDALASVTVRLRLVRWVRHASRGALTGLAVCLVFVTLSHFNLLPDWLFLEAVVPIVLLLGIGIGTLTAFLRPIALMDVARLAEARLGLKERLSSALEFERAPQAALAPDAALLMRLQLEDAATYARGLKAVDAVPWKWPWESKAALGGLVLLVLALILPNLPMLIPPSVQIERKIVSKTGDKLQQTAKLIAKQADLQHLEGTRRSAASMQRLGQRLSQGRLDKKQAMVQMSKLTQQMRAEQQKMAQQNGGPGAGAKSMALAGQQMAQAMSSASASGTTGSKSSSGGQKAGGGNKSNPKNGAQGASGSKNGAADKKSGFNVPGTGKHSESQPGKSSANTPSTPEMQKAAQAMQQNDAKGLSEQLRQLASRAESGKMSPGEQQQAAQDLQKLSEALKNAPMKETQQHSQAAAAAMKRGDKSAAASEIRKAAEAAEREAQQQADQQAQADAQQSVEGAESEMAGANSAGDIQNDSGRPGQGQGKGQGKGKGSGAGEGAGEGQGLSGSNGKHGSGNGGSGGGGMAGGKPSDTGLGSSPLKHLGHISPDSPKNGKLYFGKPLNAGPSKTGPMRKVGSNPNTPAGQTTSKVPYYDYVAPARTSAESTMDKEDIPPAYRSDVRRYFNSLQPQPRSGRK